MATPVRNDKRIEIEQTGNQVRWSSSRIAVDSVSVREYALEEPYRHGMRMTS